MTKSAMVIRNVSQIASDEIKLLIKLAGLDKKIENQKGEGGFVAQFKQDIQEDDIKGMQQLLQKPVVRDFLYATIKSKTGHHVILHLDEESDTNYLRYKLNELPQNIHIDLFYIGGGHGGYVGLTAVKLLSGLRMETIKTLALELKEKAITYDAVLLHSCSSAMFVPCFRPFLTDKGVLLSYSAELGSSSNWEMTIEWLLSPNNHDFFSDQAMAKPWEAGDLGTTTCVISTKKANKLMNLDKSSGGLPDYVDASDESTFQRELVLDLLQQEKEIKTEQETDVQQFNEVIAMELFNQGFSAALKESESIAKDSSSSSSSSYRPK
ncbi:MAG: hypothetical protein PSV35_08490 [bacterium]|nr:hypothetical protein [bacterium]